MRRLFEGPLRLLLVALLLLGAAPQGGGEAVGAGTARPGTRTGGGAPGGTLRGPKVQREKAGGGKDPGKLSLPKQQIALGNQLLKKGQYTRAAVVFRKMEKRTPTAPAIQVGLGRALAGLGRCEEALAYFWPTVGLLPFNADAALSAATCSGRAGRWDDALYFDEMAVEMKPTSVRAMTSLALDRSSAGDPWGAEEAVDALLVLDPERDVSHYARAVLALRAGDLDSFDVIAALWEREQGGSFDLQRLRAQAWLDDDNPFAAMAMLVNSRRTTTHTQVRCLKAEAQRRSGYPEAAELELTDVDVTVQGIDGDAIRARLLADRGAFQEARELLANYGGIQDADLAASAWYVAWRSGQGDLPELARSYASVQTSPRRTLELLVPWPER